MRFRAKSDVGKIDCFRRLKTNNYFSHVLLDFLTGCHMLQGLFSGLSLASARAGNVHPW